MSAKKHCNRCNRTKPLSEFYTQPDGKPMAGCKACRRAAARVAQIGEYQRNPERCKAHFRTWRERHLKLARKRARECMRRLRQRRRNLAMLIGDRTGAAIIAHTYGDMRPDYLLKQAQRIRLTVQTNQDGQGSSIKSSITLPDDSPSLPPLLEAAEMQIVKE